MKRPVESVHKMELRRSARHASKENLEKEHDAAITDQIRAKNPYPDINAETNEDETDTFAKNYEPLYNSYKTLILQYVSCVPDHVRLLLITVVFILVCQLAFSECDQENSVPNCEDPVKTLSEQYPQHVSMWKAVNASIKMCLRTPDPGVTLLLHNGDGKIADCLVNRTATLISELLGVSRKSEFCYIDGRYADQLYEVDSFLTEILRQREEHGVVVFNHLEAMNHEFVRSLHFICDTDPNISDKSVVILMLKVKVQKFRDQDLDDVAREELAELWEEKLKTRYMPIIGRITKNIGSIDESIVTKCP